MASSIEKANKKYNSFMPSIPGSIIIAILLISMAIYLSKYLKGYRYTGIILGCGITVLGLSLLIVVPEGYGLHTGIFLAIIGPQYTVVFSMTFANISGYIKKPLF
ncbi:hypothetical protein BDA99DRAFT_533558 [Phascolomyces articulosus]|uniref:Uncharacterized protein n=1 Tax=Phascolomyces articulosus TaxID=60185 RepID=A0AAD5KP22_9FUNG|nr:hypothetical protein BDA99DRAFT_533558 [Phascolomyces articulosus]